METASPTVVQSPSGFGPEPDSAAFSPADGSFPFPHEPPTSMPNASRRRKSSTKPPNSSVIKRSMSTPNVRGLATATVELPGSLAEKRRNKLGYHRTSVACVHCRRRKIRCLVATDDHQSRCSNCIRLKKECNFFPVDQQPSVDTRRPRAGSKTDGAPGDGSGSASSSPTMPPGHSFDALDHPHHLPYMPAGPHHPYGRPLGSAALSPPGSAPLVPGHFDYPEHPGSVGWEPPFYDSPGGHSTPDGGPPNNFWMKPDTPLTPAYSPFTSAPPAPPFPPSRAIEASFPSPMGNGHPGKPEHDWPHPARSMSYSHLEGLAHHGGPPAPQHGPDAFNQLYQPEPRRNTSDMLPPSLRTSSIGSSSSVPDPSMGGVPLSAPPLTPGAGNPQSPYHFAPVGASAAPPPPPPSAWGSLPNQSGKAVEFGNWYNEPSGLAKVQEEDVPPHYVDEHAGMYPPEIK